MVQNLDDGKIVAAEVDTTSIVEIEKGDGLVVGAQRKASVDFTAPLDTVHDEGRCRKNEPGRVTFIQRILQTTRSIDFKNGATTAGKFKLTKQKDMKTTTTTKIAVPHYPKNLRQHSEVKEELGYGADVPENFGTRVSDAAIVPPPPPSNWPAFETHQIQQPSFRPRVISWGASSKPARCSSAKRPNRKGSTSSIFELRRA
jgi:hypothetical protein